MINQNSLTTIEGSLSAVGERWRSAFVTLCGKQSGVWERMASAWCRRFHDSLLWPSHGYYECAKCHRMHRVSWETGRRSR